MAIPFAYAVVQMVMKLCALAYRMAYPPQSLDWLPEGRSPTKQDLKDDLKQFKTELFNTWIGSTLEFVAICHTTICMKTTEVFQCTPYWRGTVVMNL